MDTSIYGEIIVLFASSGISSSIIKFNSGLVTYSCLGAIFTPVVVTTKSRNLGARNEVGIF